LRLGLRGVAAAAIALLLIATRSHCDSLGRLFFSAKERQWLDTNRSLAKPTSSTTQPQVAPAVPEPTKPRQSVTVKAPREGRKNASPERRPVMTGFVERSSGANTVWLNNEAQQIDGGYGELEARDVGKLQPK
jgi:hypothetical protein